jgi:hypothetical protein
MSISTGTDSDAGIDHRSIVFVNVLMRARTGEVAKVMQASRGALQLLTSGQRVIEGNKLPHAFHT